MCSACATRSVFVGLNTRRLRLHLVFVRFQRTFAVFWRHSDLISCLRCVRAAHQIGDDHVTVPGIGCRQTGARDMRKTEAGDDLRRRSGCSRSPVSTKMAGANLTAQQRSDGHTGPMQARFGMHMGEKHTSPSRCGQARATKTKTTMHVEHATHLEQHPCRNEAPGLLQNG